MSDLIRRSDAMGAVQDHFNADGFKGYNDGQQMMDRIKALPSVEDVTEAVHGEWVWSDEDASWKCGACCFVFEEIDWKPNYNFCPSCGARMNGGDDE